MTCVPVLTYHTLTPGRSGSALERYSHTVREFGAHLDQLDQLGYHTMLARDVVAMAKGKAEASTLSARRVCLTFDDGFLDFFEVAAPEILSRGMVATVFVPVGLIGGRATWLSGTDSHRRIMDAQHLVRLSADGIEIGVHSMCHRAMDRGSKSLLQREASEAKSRLEEALGSEVSTFAYPFGYHSRLARSEVRDAGFDGAFALSERPVRLGWDDAYALPRFLTPKDCSLPSLRRLLERQRSRPADVLAEAKRSVHAFYRRSGASLGTQAPHWRVSCRPRASRLWAPSGTLDV